MCPMADVLVGVVKYIRESLRLSRSACAGFFLEGAKSICEHSHPDFSWVHLQGGTVIVDRT